VSGAAPPALPGAATDCFHCGLPVPAGAAFGFDGTGGWRAFCCAGCEAVSRAISGRGLDDYYRVRALAAPRPQPRDDAEELALYDEAAVQQRFAREAAGGSREAALLVDGMRCTACAWLIERVVLAVPGVVEARVQLDSRRNGAGYDSSGGALTDRRWIYEYDAQAEAVAIA